MSTVGVSVAYDGQRSPCASSWSRAPWQRALVVVLLDGRQIFGAHPLRVCRCVEKVFSLGGLVAQFCRYTSSLFEHEDTLFASLSEFMGALHSDACGNLIKYLVLHALHLLSL